MSKISIDIVLLPDGAMAEQAINVSRLLAQNFNDSILLDKETCLPHISLVLGVIEETDLPLIYQILEDIAHEFNPIKLVADIYQFKRISTGDLHSSYNIEKNPELKRIFETVVSRLRSFLTFDADFETLVSSPPSEEITLEWINRYREKLSYEKFQPHITLGFGRLDNVTAPIVFSAPALALCRLGNYCTCRQVLFSEKFKVQ